MHARSLQMTIFMELTKYTIAAAEVRGAKLS